MKRVTRGSVKHDRILASLDEVRELSNKGSYQEAVEAGVKGLKELGIRMSPVSGMWPLLFEINRVKKHFSLRKINRISNHKRMTSEKAGLKVRLMAAMAYPAMRTNMSMWQKLLLQLGDTAMIHGQCPEGVLGYAAFGETALAYLDDEPVAEGLNRVCMTLLTENTPDEVAAMTALILGSGTSHIFGNWPETLRILEKGAMRTRRSNPSLGFLCAVRATEMTFGAGMPLAEVSRHLTMAEAMSCDDTGNGAKSMKLLYESFLESAAPGRVFKSVIEELGDGKGLQLPVNLTAAMLKNLYAFGMDDVGGAADVLETMEEEWKKLKINYIPGLIYGLEALTLCRSCMEADRRFPVERSRLYQLKGIFEYWVKRNPYAYGHVYKVIEGCCGTVERDFYGGEMAFEKAIELAEENGSLLWKAMAQKILGHHCRYLGRKHLGTYHMQTAAESYRTWGHEAIAEHLLRAEGLRLPPEEIALRWVDHEAYKAQIMDKALKLTEEISFLGGPVKETFIKVISSYLSTEKGMIFEEKDDQLVRASDGQQLENLLDVSRKSLYHARRHRESVVINTERHHQIARYDSYLMDHREVCLMAVPMVDGDYFAGVFYCERETSFEREEEEAVLRVTGHVAYLLKTDHKAENKKFSET